MVGSDCIQTLVHDGDPAILGREHEERHERLTEVVKVVLVIDPPVALLTQLQTLALILDDVRVGAFAVEEDALEKLKKHLIYDKFKKVDTHDYILFDILYSLPNSFWGVNYAHGP